MKDQKPTVPPSKLADFSKIPKLRNPRMNVRVGKLFTQLPVSLWWAVAAGSHRTLRDLDLIKARQSDLGSEAREAWVMNARNEQRQIFLCIRQAKMRSGK